jgi:hypothetical protein
MHASTTIKFLAYALHPVQYRTVFSGIRLRLWIHYIETLTRSLVPNMALLQRGGSIANSSCCA